ncbi:MAG: hypothetical protein KC417_17625, partial [Myxococcales bacterium]|nr:hypothetical protein [Myxococcales bacterium]
RAVEEHAYDVVVVDTAPSRYALDFVGYPGRLASLFEGKAVGWFAALAPKAKTQDLDEQSSDGGLLSWGKRKAEALVAKILGPSTAEAITDLFGELARARERFANLSRTAETLLLGEQTRFILVAAPTGSAVADAEYLATHLVDLGKRPSAIVLNRADRDVPSWLRGDPNAAPDALSELLELARRERGAIVKAADAAERELRSRIPKATLVRLPTVDDWDPRRVVETLGTELEPLGASITRAPSPSRAPSA